MHTHRQAGRHRSRQSYRQAEASRQVGKQTSTQVAYIQVGRETVVRTDMHSYRQAGEQTYIHTDRKSYKLSYSQAGSHIVR